MCDPKTSHELDDSGLFSPMEDYNGTGGGLGTGKKVEKASGETRGIGSCRPKEENILRCWVQAMVTQRQVLLRPKA